MDVNSMLSSPRTDLYARPPASFGVAKRPRPQLDLEDERRPGEKHPKYLPHHYHQQYDSRMCPLMLPCEPPPTLLEQDLTLPPIQNFSADRLTNHLPTLLPSFELHRPEQFQLRPPNCDEIREKIRHYLGSGKTWVTQFQRTLAVNSNSYGRFMRLRGTESGLNNQTYKAAVKFFKCQDQTDFGFGRPFRATRYPPSKSWSIDDMDSAFTATKIARQNEQSRSSSGISLTSYSGKPPQSTAPRITTAPLVTNTATPLDVSHIRIQGLTNDNVAVYDTCDEIRSKISAYLSRPNITQADFLRTLAAQFSTEPRKFQSKQLNTFRRYRGANKGNTSAIFYASYVYFERLRVKEGREKSTHRLEMERVWPHGFEVRSSGPSQRG